MGNTWSCRDLTWILNVIWCQRRARCWGHHRAGKGQKKPGSLSWGFGSALLQGKRLGENRSPDLSAVNILIFPSICHKTVPPTQHTCGFVSTEAEWFVEHLQAAKMSWVGLFPKMPCGGSLEAPWKSRGYGDSEHQILKALQVDIWQQCHTGNMKISNFNTALSCPISFRAKRTLFGCLVFLVFFSYWFLLWLKLMTTYVAIIEAKIYIQFRRP